MGRLNMAAIALVVPLVCYTQLVVADSTTSFESKPLRSASNELLSLVPPTSVRPVVVQAHFEFNDINGINDELETFDFSGVLTLKWRDPRQAFDPAAEGVDERVFQGSYQFNELSPAWYPQVILVNESGLFQKSGVILRVQPDGTSTLTETVNATAKGEYNMRLYPYDKQRLKVVFEVLGFNRDEVMFRTEPEVADSLIGKVRIPEWKITEASVAVQDIPIFYSGKQEVSSSFVISVDVDRESFFIVRMIILPLVLIVLLSFSVFWMDKSSIGDRLSVSFIGLLTAVSYQVIVSDHMPHIAYFTLMHAFLNISFFAMCLTVVINLVVNALDKKGESSLGDYIDFRCRWIFPVANFGFILVVVVGALILFDHQLT